MDVSELLLVLILIAGGDDQAAAGALQAELQRLGGDQVQVVVGADAHARLEAYDLTLADLAATPQIGRQLTKHAGDLVLLRLASRSDAGDTLLECDIWRAGAFDRVTAIAGDGGDALPGLLTSLRPLLGEGFNGAAVGRSVGLASIALADLVAAERWTDVLARLAATDALDPKQSFYQVLAYSRLGNRTAALEALNAMRASHGHHWMVAAAEAEVPARDAELAAATEDDLLLPIEEEAGQLESDPEDDGQETSGPAESIDEGAEEDLPSDQPEVEPLLAE